MSDLGQIEFLPPLVERVQRVAPGVRLEAVASDLEHISDALGAGALDLAVGFLPALGPPVQRRAESLVGVFLLQYDPNRLGNDVEVEP
jgi:DNA-binding transcriptional LysR family regulator